MENTGLITLEYVNTVIKERPREIHKGQCGRVLIVAGSVGMAGAAALSARGALKSGAGLVQLSVPWELYPILQVLVPQVTCLCTHEELSSRSLENYDSIAIGPGLGVDEKNYRLIEDILKRYKGPVVLDADALNTTCQYSPKLSMIRDREGEVIITPHPGEGDRLLKALGEKSIRETGRCTAAELLGRKTGAAVLLKGAGTVVTMTGRGTYINTTGNPGMATGGSGDVLTGVIASLAAWEIEPFDAAKAGAFVHGMAGDIAAQRLGQWGMTSVDIEESLPAAFKKIIGK
ncbi:MAG: NAD(P)H-hydrate dehydratase [Clostridiales bacterium]|nr:NAD(P)H-hydrate dehydratase [Clostridiales bacterium]